MAYNLSKAATRQDFLGPPLLLHGEEEVVVFHGVL